MNCPKCGGRTLVDDTRKSRGMVLRSRRCMKCKHKFYTKEAILPKILAPNTPMPQNSDSKQPKA